jgi:hypothetical protein
MVYLLLDNPISARGLDITDALLAIDKEGLGKIWLSPLRAVADPGHVLTKAVQTKVEPEPEDTYAAPQVQVVAGPKGFDVDPEGQATQAD